MRMRHFVICAVMFTMLAGAVRAGHLEVFRASRHGDAVWAWGDARVKRKGPHFVFEENNKDGGHGDAYTADRFPYFPDGIIEIDVHRVLAGQYIFQVLGFRQGVHVVTADLIPSTTQTGKQTLPLSDYYMPDGVDEVAFKVWVELEEGAAVAVSEVAYYVSIEDQLIALDERFINGSPWTPDQLELRDVAGRKAMVLNEEVNLGSMIHAEKYTLSDIDTIVLSVLAVQNGAVSVQFPVFDDMGTYIDSVDIIRDVGPGLHARRLTDVTWPERADSFVVKIWLSGQEAGSVLDRLVLIKPRQETVSAEPEVTADEQ